MRYDDLQCFDPKDDVHVVERAVPHWTQPGVITFITWRLADSLPREVLERLDAEISSLLANQGLNPKGSWKLEAQNLPLKKRSTLQRKLFAVRDKYLDKGYGGCQLRSPEVAQIVLNSLRHFDLERYFLTDAVIMPNHVHCLCAFACETEMLKQCTEWKRFTARQINRQVRRSGDFWQVDQFDHLVRSPEQFEHLRRYVAMNPRNAQLKSGEYLYYTVGQSLRD